MDRAALDRTGADQRHLHREVVEVRGQGAREHLHLGAALDLEDARRLGPLDRAPDLGVVERHPREVDPLAARARDLVHAALDRRQHPQAQQVDLEEAGVRAGVLVPLDHLAALHRRGLTTGQRLDQRLVEITMPPGCWERWRGRPAISGSSSASARQRGERRARRPSACSIRVPASPPAS